ncbi:MAG: RNA polymerase subunit sigma [Alphaproteobacteria bacterium]|nr:MAG: RNA polymerase subunit sigma [Alphaproteobacteria bacterium]
MDADQNRQALVANLQRVASGDRAALKDVYDATSAKLFGVCLRILGNRSEAEDVLQEVYITVWSKADRFDADRASPITWLAALARNRAIDRQRQIGRRSFKPIDDAHYVADGAESSLASLVRSEEFSQLQGCMSELDATHQAALRSAFFEGLTYQDVAERHNVPTGTMKSWIRRSLLKLKACLAR